MTVIICPWKARARPCRDPPDCPRPLSLQPPEATAVNAQLSLLEDSGQVYWFLYLQVCDCYLQGDRPARARCLARFLTWGLATAAELAQALGISARTVTRARLRMQREGESSFGRPRQPRRRHGIEDPAVLARAAERLQGGASLRGVARELELCFETLRQYKREGLLPGIAAQRESGRAVGAEAAAGAGSLRAGRKLGGRRSRGCWRGSGIRAGRSARAAREFPPSRLRAARPAAVDKAGRNRRDAAAAMGRAARDVGGRVAASLGLLAERLPSFEATATVANGGVLTAVPALLQAGLLRHASLLHIPPGFYGLRSVLLLLAFMLLARVRNAERLRYEQPGEWGALLGLDRCPEARTLRRKLDQLAADPEALHAWRAALAGQWAADDPETAATLFVDGHVKLYSGKANLPKHFVARQKLQLPAAAGYWLNALGGAPLLCIHKQVDPKMVAEIRHGIVPQLEALGLLAPAAGAAAEPHLTLVFDREGWSPQLFRWLAAKGIACITWRKGAQTERWPDSEFRPERVTVRSPLGAAMLEAHVAERKAPLLPGCEAREVRFWIAALAQARPLRLSLLRPSDPRSRLWNEFVERYHYLGYKPLPGAQLRYFVHAADGLLLALLGCGAAAWKTAPRDRFVGWDPATRQRNLPLVVNHARYLILPWIRLPSLASHLLACLQRQLPHDWQQRYGMRPVLLETFCETPRFQGTC